MSTSFPVDSSPVLVFAIVVSAVVVDVIAAVVVAGPDELVCMPPPCVVPELVPVPASELASVALSSTGRDVHPAPSAPSKTTAPRPPAPVVRSTSPQNGQAPAPGRT